MKLKLEIRLDNAPFMDGENGSEVARILCHLLAHLNGHTLTVNNTGTLRDINGNLCGQWRVTK